jgi:glycosyltransferase involved in cell wall biosynthesis
VELGEGTRRVKGQLDPRRIQVVPIRAGMRGAPRNCLLLLRHLIHRPFAVFFLPAILTMVPLLPLAKLLTRRMAVYLAGDYLVTLAEEHDRKWLGWHTLFRLGFEGALRLADVVIARGRYLAKVARRCNANAVETVPLGHMQPEALSEVRALTAGEPRRALYLGLLLRSKGLDDLLRAMRLLVDRRADSDISLDVVGDGPDRADLENLCHELHLESCVRFHGWVESADEIATFFARSHAVVMPTSTHPEGVPRVIDEALVRRIPVVATRIAGVPEEFREDEVLLVEPGAPDQIADGVEALLFDSEVRSRYIEGAERRRRHWERFDSAAAQHARILAGELPDG